MADQALDPDKLKVLEQVRDQLGQGWLQTEREKARLAAAIDNLSLGVAFVDDYNKIIRKNPAFDRVLGECPNGEWTIEEIQKCVEGNYDLVLACKTSFSERKPVGPIDLNFCDKLLRIFLSPIVLLRESVTVFGVALVFEDISYEKEIGQTRDEFLAIASHELKGPLTAMKLNTEKIIKLLENHADSIAVKSSALRIKDDADKLIQIVHDFVDLSKIESGKIPFKREVFTVSETIKEVINDLSEEANSKRVKLLFEELQDGFKVLADKARTRQVFYNLMVNAIRYTQQGQVKVTVDKRDEYLKISVADTGPGIDDVTKKLLFKKFIKSPNEGSGLGLYISKLLVSDMGGEIFLDRSEVGKGSTFAFTLPLAVNTV